MGFLDFVIRCYTLQNRLTKILDVQEEEEVLYFIPDMGNYLVTAEVSNNNRNLNTICIKRADYYAQQGKTKLESARQSEHITA